MSHDEHSAMIVIVGVGGVIGELSASGSRLVHLLSTLFFILADFVVQYLHSIEFCRLGPSWKLPFLLNTLQFFSLSSKIRSFFHRSNLVCLVLGQICPFLLNHIPFLCPSMCRACSLPRHGSLFKHHFLQPTTLIKDQRKREDSPLLV